ncbi:MAG: YdeI/OmpD-associated family protein [Bacteroidota bacterium]
MAEKNTLYLTTRTEWRNWLESNFATEAEAWLVYPKKVTGKPRIAYNDAVEEALCFGWIDSIMKTLDSDHSQQRFTPRKSKHYSQPNTERLRWLANQNMIHPNFQSEVNRVLSEEFIFPSDILEAIRVESTAWDNYQSFSEAYRRIRIAYIDSARRRPEEFSKRLNNFIEKTRKNQLIAGYGGIDKYY